LASQFQAISNKWLQKNNIPEEEIVKEEPTVTIVENVEESAQIEQNCSVLRLKENNYPPNQTSEIISDLEAILPMTAYSRYNSKFQSYNTHFYHFECKILLRLLTLHLGE
jgi:hypothetical protein